MAQIPRYQSKQQLDSGSNFAAGMKQDLSAGDRMMAQADKGKKAVDSFAEKMQKATDFAEYNDAFTGSTQAVAQIQANADKDQNPDNQQEYLDQIANVKSEVMSSLAGHLQQKYAVNFDAAASVAGINIQKSFWDKQVVRGQTALYNGLEALSMEYAGANDQKTIDNIMLRKKQLLDESVAAGYQNPLQAAKMNETTKSKWTEDKVMQDMRDDAQQTMDNLKDPEYYQELDPERRTYFMQLAGQMKTKEQKAKEAEAVRIQEETESKLEAGLADGSMGLVDIVNGVASGVISDKKAWKYFDYAMREHKYMTTKDGAWNEILDNATDPKKTLAEFTEKVVDLDGVNPDDLKEFRDFVTQNYNRAIREKAKPQRPEWMDFNRMKETMKDWVKRHSASVDQAKDLADMTKVLYRGLASGQIAPDQVMNVGRKLIQGKIVEKYPSTGTLPETPAVVAKDGSFERVNETSDLKPDRVLMKNNDTIKVKDMESGETRILPANQREAVLKIKGVEIVES